MLVQRGRGGGLTGALGGPGGQSAFGSKAGDTFTVITIVVASVWGFTCAFTMWLLGTHTPSKSAPATVSAGPADDDLQDDPTSGIVIPKPSGSAFGESGLSGLSSGDSEKTPSVELTPADGNKTPASDDSESPGDASGPSSESDAASGESTASEGSSENTSSTDDAADREDNGTEDNGTEDGGSEDGGSEDTGGDAAESSENPGPSAESGEN